MTSHPSEPARTPFYSLLLHMYPRSFRREYGHEMRLSYRDLRRDEPAGRVFVRITRDAVISAPRARFEEGIMRSTGIAAAIVAVAVAIGGAITGSFFVGGLVVVGALGIIVAAAALLSRTGNRSAERDYAPSRAPWWMVLAGALAAFEVVFGIGQLIHEPKKENVFALGVMLAFAGLFAGGVSLRYRGHSGGNWMIASVGLPMLGAIWWVWPSVLGLATMVGAISEVFRVRRVKPKAV